MRLGERQAPELQILGVVRCRLELLEIPGDEAERQLVGDAVREIHADYVAPARCHEAGLLAQLARGGVERPMRELAAALGDLPAVAAEGIAILPDQDGAA